MVQIETVEIDGNSYYTAAHVAKVLGISRQTLWRWRQEGRIPPGHRYRGRQVVFTEDELTVIRDFANRIEPIGPATRDQLKLFGDDGKRGPV